MTTTLNAPANGRPRRTLNETIGQLDQMIEGLSTAIPETIRDTLQEHVAAAVSEGVRSALVDILGKPVPDQVGFRLDFPAWRLRRCERDRRLIDDLMVGERALDVANRYGLSPARISQLRRAFHQDWLAFCDELPEQAPATSATHLAPRTN
jgi:hypothetical protein